MSNTKIKHFKTEIAEKDTRCLEFKDGNMTALKDCQVSIAHGPKGLKISALARGSVISEDWIFSKLKYRI